MLNANEYQNEYGYRMNHHRTDSPREERFVTKWQRMKYLEKLLIRRVWTRAALARELQVNRSTIGRYIDEMSEFVQIQEDEKKRLTIADSN